MSDYKTCTKCGVEKPLTDFHRLSRSKDGRKARCAECANIAQRDWRAENPERVRQLRAKYYQANPQKHRDRQKAYYAANRSERLEYAKEYAKKYEKTHRKQRLANQRKYVERHREAVLEYGRIYRAKNPQKMSEWAKQNPERRRKNEARRRTRKAQNGVYTTTGRELLRLYSSPCVACGSIEDITADHIVPIARGGRDSIGNLQPLCGPCNSSKKDKLMIEWRVWRDKLAGPSVGAA